jgi:hypothetical protein
MDVMDRDVPSSFSSQAAHAEFLSHQAQYEKGWRQSMRDTWLSCSPGGMMLLLAFVAVGALVWSMYEAAALLACNHEKGNCNFQVAANRRLYWGVPDETGMEFSKATWNEASAACTAYGSTLISISNSSENDAVSAQLTNSFKGACADSWIGASDSEKEGVWHWTGEGSPGQVTFNAWTPPQDMVNNKSQQVWEPNCWRA